MAEENGDIIIIKKIKKGHGGHHGGAWKVAYADFVTAMMALFLVLWLVAMLSKDAKKAVAEYFRSYTIFKGNEAGGGKGISMMQGAPVSLKLDRADQPDFKNKESIRERIALELGKVVEEKLTSYKDQVMILNTSEGVRLEVMELEQSPVFELGKANLLPRGTELLDVLAHALKDMDEVRVTIEGHTDSHNYPGENYTNWELAADRANAARREIIKDGMDPSRINKVTSYADVVPFDKDNPFSSLNRRVSFLLEIPNEAKK